LADSGVISVRNKRSTGQNSPSNRAHR